MGTLIQTFDHDRIGQKEAHRPDILRKIDGRFAPKAAVDRFRSATDVAASKGDRVISLSMSESPSFLSIDRELHLTSCHSQL